MRKSIAIILCIIRMTDICHGQNDSTTCVERRLSAQTFRQKSIDMNAMPTAMYDKMSYSLSDVSLGVHKRDKGVETQKGDGARNISFGTNAYVRRTGSVMWGDARYENKTTYDINWNESADIEKVGPFVTADSVGGDIKSEEYAISGGLAARRGAWTWGGELSYDAKIETRDVDPRPKNIASDLTIKIGASWGKETLADISAYAERYKQTGDIDTYNSKSAAKIYHLTGMAQHYQRFAGQADETFYDGHGIGAAIGVHQRNHNGVNAKAEISKYGYDKILTGSQYNDAPICALEERAIVADIRYIAETWGASAEGRETKREGTLNIFGESTNNTYNKISEYKAYEKETKEITARGHYEWATSGVRAHVRLTSEDEKYRSPSQTKKTKSITEGIEIYKHIRLGQSRIKMEAKAVGKTATSSDLDMQQGDKQSMALMRLVQERYEIEASDMIEYGGDIEAAYSVKGTYTLSAEIKWESKNYKQADKRVNDITLTLHFCF